MIHKLKHFTKKIHKGLKQELQETKDIPKHIKNKEFDKATEQIGDIGKMTFLSTLWILPGGAVMSGFLVKYFKKMRPSAFREKEDNKTLFDEISHIEESIHSQKCVDDKRAGE